VNPESAGLSVNISCSSDNWGCGYTYGFRVPLLVVSAYTKKGYVSGDTRTVGGGEVFPFIHDFGSLLGFVENNFLGPSAIGQINPQYQFADFFAPDWQPNKHVPLSDLFDTANFRNFTPITPSSSFPLSYFTNNPGAPEGPGDNGDPD
jgi:phospholipase C